uniref:Pseudouridylate synthase 1 homolog n=1 Tax=Glossina austeni TaxID=7395 RepID=A0A1A9VB88_GLOAU
MLLFGRLLRNLKAERLSTIDIACHSVDHSKGFAAAMAEALEKLEQQKLIGKEERKVAETSVNEMKRMKQKLKRRKWVNWETEDERKSTEAKRAAIDSSVEKIKRKKCAILLGYSGANYYGMQRNPGMETIEEELFKVLLKHKWISHDAYGQAQVACFQRAARTDKGVSAARQVCSMKLPEALDIKAFNEDLPEQIRLFAAERVTKGFNAKGQCDARTYTYTMPSVAFSDFEASANYETFRLPAEQLQKAKEILQKFEGTKNFHNFTSRKNFFDPSSKRFIMSFTCSDPFLSPQNIEFITVKVKGQSFMLHQIRKMVGLTIAIVRGHTGVPTLNKALSEERIDLPMAPGLGLVLDTVHYERYNERYGKDGIHNPLTWENHETEIQQFVEQKILANIYETEYKEKPLLNWLETLPLHSYDVRNGENPPSSEDKSNKDENEE